MLFSHSIMSDSLQPHGVQHASLPCPLPTLEAYSNSCPSSWWCHPTISSFVVPFTSCLQSFTASGSFQKSQFFASGGWSIGASASASVFPMNIQDWFLLGLTCLMSLQSKFKASILWHSAFFMVQLSHPYMTTGKTIVLTRWTFVGKVISLLFNMLSRLVITFLSRSKRLYFMAAVTICSDFGAQKNKVWHCFHCFSMYLPWNDGTRCHDLHFLNVEL